MENFRARETGPDSQISGLTTVRSNRFTLPDEPSSSSSTMESTESMSTEWTDEKHSLYLKSMEATFVNELYDSMEMLGWHQEKEDLSHAKASKQTHPNHHGHPGEFKVLRSGSWQKINFERAESQVIKTNEIDHVGLLSNPWIMRFRSVGKTQVVVGSCGAPQGAVRSHDSNRKKAMSNWGASSSKNFSNCHSNLCHQDFLGNKTEVSDQNFIDEDNIEGEKSKRVKTLVQDPYTDNDQVVPRRRPQ